MNGANKRCLQQINIWLIQCNVWRDHCNERPPVLKDHIFQGRRSYISMKIYLSPKTVRPPVLTGHIFTGNGVVFQEDSTVYFAKPEPGYTQNIYFHNWHYYGTLTLPSTSGFYQNVGILADTCTRQTLKPIKQCNTFEICLA